MNQITRSYLILSWQVFRVEFFLYIPFDSKALSQKEYIRKNSTREPCNVKKEYRVGWVKKRLSPRWIITRNLPNAHSLSFQSVSKLVKTIKITRNFINQLKVLNSVIIQGLREPSPWIISTSGNTTLPCTHSNDFTHYPWHSWLSQKRKTSRRLIAIFESEMSKFNRVEKIRVRVLPNNFSVRVIQL